MAVYQCLKATKKIEEETAVVQIFLLISAVLELCSINRMMAVWWSFHIFLLLLKVRSFIPRFLVINASNFSGFAYYELT
jgi:hypothetical protein